MLQSNVERYLKTRLPQIDPAATDLSVADLHRMPRGVSRETWSVRTAITTPDGTRSEEFVIRRDLHGGVSVAPVSLRFEFDVYARLADSGIPVTRALWYDEASHDLEEGGGAVYVRTKVDGDWQIPHFNDPDPRWDELRIETSKEHLRKLALVHTCDYRTLGFGDIMEVPSLSDAARSALRIHEDRVRALSDAPEPLLDAAVARLRETAPATASSVGLCKGTNGFGEEVFKNGRIVAMSDWELSLIGDPAYDWAQLQLFVPTVCRDGVQVWGEPQALAYYEAVSGIHIDPATIRWYRQLNGLIKFGYCQNASRSVLTGVNPGVRMAWASTEVKYRSRLLLAEIAGIEVTR